MDFAIAIVDLVAVAIAVLIAMVVFTLILWWVSIRLIATFPI